MSTATLSPALSAVRSMAKPKAKAEGASKKFATSIPGIQPHIDTWLSAKAEADRFTSLMKSAEDQILSAGVPALVDECRRAGRLETSIRLNNSITLTRTCRYSPIPDERIDEVKAALPEERYFADKLTITVNADAAADESFLRRLIESLGPDECAARFTVSRSVTPTEEFHRDVTIRREVAEAAAVFQAEEVIRNYKSSLRA